MNAVATRSISLLLTGSLLTGCATIVNHSTQPVKVTSHPSGAFVTIDGAPYGPTPFTTHLLRKETHQIHIQLEGYEPQDVMLTRHVSGWFFGNVLIGGLIGIAIDAMSGSMYKLTPKQIEAELRQQGQMSLLQEDGVYIATALEAKGDWQKIGQLAKR